MARGLRLGLGLVRIGDKARGLGLGLVGDGWATRWATRWATQWATRWASLFVLLSFFPLPCHATGTCPVPNFMGFSRANLVCPGVFFRVNPGVFFRVEAAPPGVFLANLVCPGVFFRMTPGVSFRVEAAPPGVFFCVDPFKATSFHVREHARPLRWAMP